MSPTPKDERFYPLCEAMFGDWNVAAELLNADPIAIEARSGTGETALYYLTVENELEAVKWLLERGADLNTRDDFQCTPLIAAAQLGYLEMCRFLLENDADIFAQDHIESSAISAVASAKKTHDALLELLLQHKGAADINLFFSDIDADILLTHKNPRVAQFWNELGLTRRFDDSDIFDEGELDTDKAN